MLKNLQSNSVCYVWHHNSLFSKWAPARSSLTAGYGFINSFVIKERGSRWTGSSVLANHPMTMTYFLRRDLQRLSEIEPQLTAAADCARVYIECQLLLAKVTACGRRMRNVPVTQRCYCLQILSNKSWLNFSAASPLQSNALKSLLEQVQSMLLVTVQNVIAMLIVRLYLR